MALRASSAGSGRTTRSSSVCQMRSMFSASLMSWRRRSASMTGVSRSAAMRRSLLSTERRAASVGCAVKTGRTLRFLTVSRRCSGSASLSRSAVRARSPPSAARRSRISWARWTCSVTLARWKYVEKARTSCAAVSRSVSPRSWAAASPSVRVRARTRSTRSRRSWPSWRTRVSPSRSPRRRMSARSSGLAAGVWSALLTVCGSLQWLSTSVTGGPGLSRCSRHPRESRVRTALSDPPRIGVRGMGVLVALGGDPDPGYAKGVGPVPPGLSTRQLRGTGRCRSRVAGLFTAILT